VPAPVLLVHGFASSFERNWREPGWVDLLTDAGREVISTDLLGHGSSPKPHNPGEYVRLESDVAALLRPETPVDAIGFSLGARLLLSVAATRPGSFGRLVVGGVGESVLRADDPEPVASAVESLADEAVAGPVAAGAGAGGGDTRGAGLTDTGSPRSGPAVAARSSLARALVRFARTPGNDPVALAACLRRPVAPLSAELLADVQVPVLVVLGDQDYAGPAEPLVDALPEASLVVLEGVDHLATPMNFGFIDAALEFLGALPD
jgi:pimeloyl-ACP methyl ester carboxylesterase